MILFFCFLGEALDFEAIDSSLFEYDYSCNFIVIRIILYLLSIHIQIYLYSAFSYLHCILFFILYLLWSLFFCFFLWVFDALVKKIFQFLHPFVCARVHLFVITSSCFNIRFQEKKLISLINWASKFRVIVRVLILFEELVLEI